MKDMLWLYCHTDEVQETGGGDDAGGAEEPEARTIAALLGVLWLGVVNVAEKEVLNSPSLVRRLSLEVGSPCVCVTCTGNNIGCNV